MRNKSKAEDLTEMRQRPTFRSALLWCSALFGVALLMLNGLGSFALVDPSEGYYAEGAREMVESGNYLVPSLNYAPYYEKPALIYWLISISYHLFGVSEFASRLPSVVSAMVLLVVFYFIVREFFNRRAAIFSTLVLLSSPLFFVIKSLALTDMVFSSLYAISSLLLFLGLEKRRRLWLRAGYVALGLAVLCKGPLAIVLMCLTFSFYFFMARNSPFVVSPRLSDLAPVSGMLIVALVALPWYVTVHVATGGDFSQVFFVEHNFGRLTHLVPKNHTGPVWFYIPVLLGGLFPWSFLLLGMLASVKTRFTGRMDTKRGRLLAFAFGSALTGFLLFSMASSKLPTYALPLVPAFAILAGASLDLCARLKRQAVVRAMACSVVIAAGISIFLLPALCEATTLTAMALTVVSMLLLGYLLLFVATFRQPLVQNLAALVALTVVSVAAMVPLGLKINDQRRDQGLKQFISTARAYDASVATYLRESPVAAFYYRDRVPELEKPPKLKSLDKSAARDPRPEWFITTVDLSQSPAYPDVNLLSKNGRWFLFTP